MNENYILLLTGCINPDGMPFTSLTEKSIRRSQYLSAIDFYLTKTNFPIIFAENSGTDLSDSYTQYIDKKRLEILSFNGNKNKKKGKGYGESEIIDYALSHSHIISSYSTNCIIIKITGRLIVNNINQVAYKHMILQKSNSVISSLNSTLTFADSRIIIAPIFFFSSILKHREEIDDSKGVYFETILLNCIIQEKRFHYYPFYIEPQISGQSGTTREKYEPYVSSPKRRREYLLYVLQTILKFDKELSNNKLNKHIRLLYIITYYVLKIMNKYVIR